LSILALSFFKLEPSRRLEINENDYDFFADKNYYKDINEAYTTVFTEVLPILPMSFSTIDMTGIKLPTIVVI
jgi:hypothetical protein